MTDKFTSRHVDDWVRPAANKSYAQWRGLV